MYVVRYDPGKANLDAIVEISSIMWWEDEPSELLTKSGHIKRGVCRTLAEHPNTGVGFEY